MMNRTTARWRYGIALCMAAGVVVTTAPGCGGGDSTPVGALPEAGTTPSPDAAIDVPPPSSTPDAASPPAGCSLDADCAPQLPATSPAGCAEARCDQGRCAFRAKDADGDGERASNCKAQSSSTTIETGSDCDDADPDVASRRTEQCDGKDNDCNGRVDEGVAASTVPCSTDLKGVCEGKGVYECADGKFSKCNAVPKAQPQSKKECDGTDWNCDGKVDRAGCVCAPGTTQQCNQQCGPGYAITCDANGAWPACDPGPSQSSYCVDADGDGYPGQCGTYCPNQVPGGWQPQGNFGGRANSLDCDDGNGGRNPGAAEVCDGIDNNCANGIADEPNKTCGACPQVACSGACAAQCRQGYTFDPGSNLCVSTETHQETGSQDLSIGGAFSCGLNYNKVYGGACPDGRRRAGLDVRKVAGGNGHCEGYWQSDDPYDCSVLVHFGTAWCDNFTCHIDIESNDLANQCQ